MVCRGVACVGGVRCGVCGGVACPCAVRRVEYCGACCVCVCCVSVMSVPTCCVCACAFPFSFCTDTKQRKHASITSIMRQPLGCHHPNTCRYRVGGLETSHASLAFRNSRVRLEGGHSLSERFHNGQAKLQTFRIGSNSRLGFPLRLPRICACFLG